MFVMWRHISFRGNVIQGQASKQLFIIMPRKKFTPEEATTIATISKQAYKYIAVYEAQSIAIRTNLKEYYAAVERVNKDTPPLGWMPPKDEINACRLQFEKICEMEPQNFDE